MGEAVELRAEEMIPELENMLSLLFDKDEVQSLHSMRKEFEYKIHRVIKRKDDFVKYINFETQFLRMLKLRYKKKGIQKNAKLTNIELAIGRRLNRLFVLAIRSFSRDLRLWMAYVKFCQNMPSQKFHSSGIRVLDQLLQYHGHSKPELYKLAARIELDNFNDVDKARNYLLMGIHIHKDCKSLLTEAFRMELIDAERKHKELAEKGLPIDPNTVKKAESIYDCSIKRLKDVVLMNELVKICAKYEFASQLQNKICNDMFEHEHDERMWNFFATRDLHTQNEKQSLKTKIQNCVTVYETAIKRVNTPMMWAFYLDTLVELGKESLLLRNYKRKLLLSALQKAATAGKLTEKYYLIWVSYLQGPEKHKRLVEVLKGAVKKLPDSVNLWHTLLRVHLTKGEEKSAYQVFEQAVAALTKESLPLWKLMIQFELTKRNNKIEELFKKSWTQCTEISGPLKPMYLEWLVLTQGIVAARNAYKLMCEMPSPCLEMHKKMVYLETIQPTMNLKRIRQCYVIACAQFNDLSVDIWMDYCKFEIKNGDPKRIGEIYWRARKELSPQLWDQFIGEFSLVYPIPPNNPVQGICK